MNKATNHISASSISAFKACPTRYRLAYVEAIRPATDAQPLRMGTAWHKGLEVLEMVVGTVPGDEGFPLPVGVSSDPLPTVTEENRFELAVAFATQVYEIVPDWADPTDWAIEREIVANALCVYHWLYGSESEYETVATELDFDLPLVNPETGHSTPNFRRVGKIDRIIRHKGSGRMLIQENKSTSKAIDSGSTYWDRLRKDTQSKFYILAARAIQAVENWELAGCMGGDARMLDRSLVSGLLHDVFHKPQIRPKKLTMAESAKFVEAESHDYCGQQFDVRAEVHGILVDGVLAELDRGKKEGTYAIRETPGMYGARLFQDMTERPEFYFARREIAFTDAELEDFQYQLWALQKNMNDMERTGRYWENEQQCEATFRCPYLPICYNNVQCCDGVTVPPGFKRIEQKAAEQTAEAEE